MSDEIVVYNLQDDGTSTDAVASQPASTTGVVASATASTAAPSGSSASSITEGDVRNFIHQELAHYSGDIRVGAMLSGQVFILDPEGLRMGGTKFSDAPFSVTYDGHLIATSATITIATLGGFDIGSDYIRDTANTFGLASTVTGGNDVRFWSGVAFASRTTAPFRLYEDGSFVATDGTFSGTVRTSVFEKDVVSAVGGQLIVANADVLDTAMTALDSATLTIKGETTFAVNDMLHLKDGTDEEYMRVTAIGSAPTYTVTRDLAAAYASNSNPAWAAGTAVVVEGSSDGASTYSGGFLKLLGSGTNSPKYSVYKRTGAAYSGITEYCTLGNLNGQLDYVAEDYGIAIGTLTSGYMSYDQTNGLRVNGSLNPTLSVVAGENLTVGDPVCIRTNEIIKQVASHDARVLQSSAGTNYGTDTTAVLGSTNATNNGDSYFFVKFDLSTITIPIADSAMIRLRADSSAFNGAAGNPMEVGVFQVTGADWDESTITWTNQPAIGAVFEDWEIARGDSISDDFIEEDSAEPYIFLDVTTLYNQWKAGSQSNYGVCIRYVVRSTSVEEPAVIQNMLVATSEHATAAFRPTIIVSGVSSNIGKAYKANSTNFTDLFGEFGICLATVSAAATATIQTSGKVSNQTGLTPGQTYYVTDSETLSTTPGTLVREVGIALSATELIINGSFARIVSDAISISSNDSLDGHNETNTIFIPIGFKPKRIDFFGTYKAAANTHTAIGVFQNGVQKTNSNDVFVDAFLAYEVPTANETTTLTVTSITDSGVLFTYQLKDDSTSVASNLNGILTFTR